MQDKMCYCRVKRPRKNILIPTWPQTQDQGQEKERHQSLTLPEDQATESYQSPGLTKISTQNPTNPRPPWKAPRLPPQETLYKPCVLLNCATFCSYLPVSFFPLPINFCVRLVVLGLCGIWTPGYLLEQEQSSNTSAPETFPPTAGAEVWRLRWESLSLQSRNTYSYALEKHSPLETWQLLLLISTHCLAE